MIESLVLLVSVRAGDYILVPVVGANSGMMSNLLWASVGALFGGITICFLAWVFTRD